MIPPSLLLGFMIVSLLIVLKAILELEVRRLYSILSKRFSRVLSYYYLYLNFRLNFLVIWNVLSDFYLRKLLKNSV